MGRGGDLCVVATVAAGLLLLPGAGSAAETKTPAPAATPAVAAAKAPVGKPWKQYKFGMTADQVRKLMGKAVEPLKAPYRLGDYEAQFRGAPIQMTKGVAMRPLPLFHWQRDSLEMLVLTADRAKTRDFVEVYQMLSATYGPSRREHSQFQGRYQVFDVNWSAGGSAITLYFDEGGRLLTLEIARSGAASPELYAQEPWLRATEWAAACNCDAPLYFNRCPPDGTSSYR